MKIFSKVMAKIKQHCLGIQAFELNIKLCFIRALFNMHVVLLNEEKKRRVFSSNSDYYLSRLCKQEKVSIEVVCIIYLFQIK